MAQAQLSPELTERIKSDIANNTRPAFAAKSAEAIRRNPEQDTETVWRNGYSRDTDKIIYSPYYNRYTDKTQVFSFYKNDDITRRALHVQLVSRIARSIGSALNLNLDLIEAISLGHDIGHTPFGHAGERYISEVYQAETGRYFNHNVHSVRVLDKIFDHNLTLDTLNGIITHNGELEMHEYLPSPMHSFADFDSMTESCYVDQQNILKIVPSTLEGCVVRVCDIIAYLGKDRQDADRAQIFGPRGTLADDGFGSDNSEMINDLSVNIIENSYGKPYIMMDQEHFDRMSAAKRKNYAMIYKQDSVAKVLDDTVRPMMQKLYYKLLLDLKQGIKSSPIYRHHVDFVLGNHYANKAPYLETEPNQIVIDYMASMTDDYCAELYRFLWPNSKERITYHGYFEDLI